MLKAIAPAVAGGLVSGGLGLIGADMSRDAQREANEANAALQREFAQNGIRWKVADAVAAGLHPLAALGAQGYSASPSYVGDTSVGNAFASMGQDLGRAITATRTKDERLLTDLQLQKAALENDWLREKIASERRLNNAPGVGPGMPDQNSFIPGQGDSSRVDVLPAQVVAHQAGSAEQEAGWTPSVAYGRMGKGLFPYIPQKMSESFEQDPIGGWMWAIHNRIAPMFGFGSKGPANPLPRGYYYRYDPGSGFWTPTRGNGAPRDTAKNQYRYLRSRYLGY